MFIKNSKGFTLIEVIIYIALFSLLMGTAFITAYHLIDGSSKLSVKNTTQEEGNFVMRKMDFVLTGIETITTPSSAPTNNLQITKYDTNKFEICLNSEKIKIHKGNYGTCADLDYLPITTDNVKATELQFELIQSAGSPDGIKVTFKLNDVPFTITKYMRK